MRGQHLRGEPRGPEDQRTHPGDGTESGRLRTPIGLAADPATGTLYTTDGHSVQSITPAGEVKTLVGNPWEPGYDAWRTGKHALPEGGNPNWMVMLPCLKDPTGLAVYNRHIFIADTGNPFHRAGQGLRTGGQQSRELNPGYAKSPPTRVGGL
jgi:hypothetical protein